MDSVIDPDLSNNDSEAKLLVATVPTTPTTTTPTTILPAAGSDLVVSVLIFMLILSSVLYLHKKSY
jgi:Co/Zn/Cd efflux system component